MGLLQDHNSGFFNRFRFAPYWGVPLVFVVVCSFAAAFADAGRDVLRYERLGIANGEYWRLISGHFVHLGPQHLLLNLAGLILVWLLVGRQYTIRQWGLVTLISLAVINAGFWYLDPGLIWYVGLSGLLHGLIIAGAVAAFKSMPTESLIICVAVAGKLIYEQLAGPLPGSAETAGGTVVVNAHLYGAVGGAISALVLWRSSRAAASI
jgi:rhomboid family GlyGly-CTERM serine protease